MAKPFDTLVSFLRAKRYLKWRIFAVGLIGLILVSRLALWFTLDHINTQTAGQNFEMVTKQHTEEIQAQFEVYADTLYAARALFLTGSNVSRQGWETFVGAQQLSQRYPAFYALAYISVINRADVGTFTARLNANRQPSETVPIAIRPLTTGDTLAVVTYVAPSTVSQVGIGTNVLADTTRAKALAEARDSGLPRASKPLTLASDPANAPPSILVALPIYSSNAVSLQTVSQRQAALQGYLALALHTKPLLDGIFTDPTDSSSFDVSITSNGQTIYQYGPKLSGPALEKQQDINIAGQTWTLNFKAPTSFELSTVAQAAPTVLTLSALPFLLIVGLILYFATRVYQPKAHNIVSSQTSNLG